jgi:hypothetical protein
LEFGESKRGHNSRQKHGPGGNTKSGVSLLQTCFKANIILEDFVRSLKKAGIKGAKRKDGKGD